jgi:DNA (cytosine-5)-methyltransferase 1
MIHIGLFEGIGGFSLAAKYMGWETYATCEIADFPNKVLQYHYPNAYHHTDIHTLTYDNLNKELINRFGHNWRHEDVIITGGFPCQPYSMAGKRLGKDDERHLFPEMMRVIKDLKPRWVVGENVRGLISWNDGQVFNEICDEFEKEDYEIQSFILPAAAVNAPHRRDRIFFVAHNEKYKHPSPKEIKSQPIISEIEDWNNFPKSNPVCDKNNTIEFQNIKFSKWRIESIKAAGNAVVPPLILKIFKAIEQVNNI